MHSEHPHTRAREGGGTYLSRVLGEAESPLWWGFPCGAIRGVRVRVHLVLPTFVLARVAYSVWSGEGPQYVAAALLGLLLVVIVHEVARYLAGSGRSGQAGSEACFWPLGAMWRSPGEVDLRLERRGALGALGASAGLAIGLGIAVVLATGDASLTVFNLLRPSATVGAISSSSTPLTLALVLLWQTYAMSVYLLLFNAIPMLPLDGAILLRERLTRGSSINAATERAARVGLAIAFLLFVAAMVAQATLLAAVAACCGLVCWLERQSAMFSADPVSLDRWRGVLEDEAETADDDSPITAEERDAMEGVLEKISTSGMASLSRSERRLLSRATEKLRGG